MSQASKIEWTDATWNPVRGCSRVSEGCRHCYAERVAGRFSGKGQPYEGLGVMKNGEPHWTGKVRLVEELLDWPLHRRKPLRIFVNSMSDLFHESVPVEWIARIFNVMACATINCGKRHEHDEECWVGRPHTFQILTKRPERMLRVMADDLPEYAANYMAGDSPLCVGMEYAWPPKNVWLGVSVEDQATADERIPLLLQAPAAVRWISAEPLLGPIDLRAIAWGRVWCNLGKGPEINRTDALVAKTHFYDEGDVEQPRLDWVVVGGESGPSARPMNIQWAESIVDQCQAAKVPVFVKQLGSGHKSWHDGRRSHRITGKGGNPAEWPENLRVRQFPELRP